MGGGEPLTVALTFDDLPVHGTLPPGVRRPDIAKGILAALQAHKVPPTYGFVNAKGLEEAPDNVEVLRLWRAAGHPLANHTFSHMDLNANSPEAFEQDIVANEATLRTFMGGDGWRWLRFPYLRQGDTPEKWRAVASFLKERGYRVAHVTISFDDYAYNDPYARCLARPDPTAVDWMRASFLERAARYISASQESAKLAFGRDIPHVMLLHLGAFDVVMLPALLDLMEQRKIRFVTLEEAQGDAAYSFDPELPSASGSTFLDRMIATRRVAAVRPAADDTLSRLANLCR
jgi:peptidoglycan/xylan/chitin deacetylase (PgdA/CDA1 family)